MLVCSITSEIVTPGEEIRPDSNTFNLSCFVTHESIHPVLDLHWHRQQRGHFVLSATVPSNCLPNPVEQIKKFGAFCLVAFQFCFHSSTWSDRSAPWDLVVDKEVLQTEQMCLHSDICTYMYTRVSIFTYNYHRQLFDELATCPVRDEQLWKMNELMNIVVSLCHFRRGKIYGINRSDMIAV